jgi:two-component system sensor histidine kinase CpxA
MHRLFWKIFLSFWLTLVVFAVVVMFAASSYLEHNRTQQDKSSIRTRLSEYFEQGQAIAWQKGMGGWRNGLTIWIAAKRYPFSLSTKPATIC